MNYLPIPRIPATTSMIGGRTESVATKIIIRSILQQVSVKA